MAEPDTEKPTDPLEDLEFDHEPPCEHRKHDKIGNGPAFFVATYIRTLPCGHTIPTRVLYCTACWQDYSNSKNYTCDGCGRNLGDFYNFFIGVTRIKPTPEGQA